MQNTISSLRQNYTFGALNQEELHPNPLEQFALWFQEALQANLYEPNAMALTTVSSGGKPSARMVLLKGFDERGFVFYTNYGSRKAQELEQNHSAALLFWWGEIQRQVRIEGEVEKVSDAESDAYFAERPRGSQLGAWVSKQSSLIAERALLEEREVVFAKQFEGQSVPRPPFWGGYRLRPLVIEFWQGRSNRLHDRLRYTNDVGKWVIERLSP